MNQLSYRAADASPTAAAFDWIMACLFLQGIVDLLITTVLFSVSVKSSTLSTCFSGGVYRYSCFILLPFMYPHMKSEKERDGGTGVLKRALSELQKPAVTL